MGTELITYEDCEDYHLNILMKRFWGGKDRGTLYNIIEKNAVQNQVNVTYDELIFLTHQLIKNEIIELENKDTLFEGHIRKLKENRRILKLLKSKLNFEVNKK